MKTILIILVCTITSCSSTHAPINKHARNVQKHKRPACEKITYNR